MDRKELIEELRQERRDLKASIERQQAALHGLDAYLKYLGESAGGRDRELSFPELQITQAARTALLGRTDDGAKPPATNGHSKKIPLSREVREILGEIEGEFTQRDVTERVVEKYPDAHVLPTSVHNAMVRAIKQGADIELVREGAGSEPHVYRRVLYYDTPSYEGPMGDENSTNGESPVSP